MPPMIRGIGCDFGKVNGDFDHEQAIAVLEQFSPLSADEIRRAIFESSLEDDYDCGRISTPHFLAELRMGLRLRPTVTDQELAAAWRNIFRRTDDNERVLRVVRLISRQTRVVLASNTNELHFEAIAAGWADLISWLDGLVLSFRVRARKPSPVFFAAVLERLGTAPAESLLIDDRADFVSAARQLGMHAVQYVPGLDLAAALGELQIRLDDDRGRPATGGST